MWGIVGGIVPLLISLPVLQSHLLFLLDPSSTSASTSANTSTSISANISTTISANTSANISQYPSTSTSAHISHYPSHHISNYPSHHISHYPSHHSSPLPQEVLRQDNHRRYGYEVINNWYHFVDGLINSQSTDLLWKAPFSLKSNK